MEKRIYPEPIESIITPEPFPRQSFTDAAEAVAALKKLYERNTAFLREAFASLAHGTPARRFRACYPEIGVITSSYSQVDSRQAYGHMPTPGNFTTTITRPDLFETYLDRADRADHAQSRRTGDGFGVLDADPAAFRLSRRHACRRRRRRTDPAPAARPVRRARPCRHRRRHRQRHLRAAARRRRSRSRCSPRQRVDYSLHRLSHYTATDARSISRTSCCSPTTSSTSTNSCGCARELHGRGRQRLLETFVEPGNVITTARARTAPPRARRPRALPQMPAYHLTRPDIGGITLVNIGVGPSNAKTITDHIAVLRPHAWLMLGHCAGLRNTPGAGRLRAGPRLCARGPRARRRPAGLGADPAAGRSAGGAASRRWPR